MKEAARPHTNHTVTMFVHIDWLKRLKNHKKSFPYPGQFSLVFDGEVCLMYHATTVFFFSVMFQCYNAELFDLNTRCFLIIEKNLVSFFVIFFSLNKMIIDQIILFAIIKKKFIFSSSISKSV